jgi:hypothetical protein
MDERFTLKVSRNNRFLARADGSPFCYLGDTAWELFHRLNREEARTYLQDRAAKIGDKEIEHAPTGVDSASASRRGAGVAGRRGDR